MISRRTLLKTVANSFPLGFSQTRLGFSSVLATSSKRLIWDVHFHLSGASGETPEERMTQLIKYADRLEYNASSFLWECLRLWILLPNRCAKRTTTC